MLAHSSGLKRAIYLKRWYSSLSHIAQYQCTLYTSEHVQHLAQGRNRQGDDGMGRQGARLVGCCVRVRLLLRCVCSGCGVRVFRLAFCLPKVQALARGCWPARSTILPFGLWLTGARLSRLATAPQPASHQCPMRIMHVARSFVGSTAGRDTVCGGRHWRVHCRPSLARRCMHACAIIGAGCSCG